MAVTVELSADVLERLEAEASRRGVTIAEVIVALAETIPEATDESAGHRLGFVGIGASGRTEPFDIHKERAELAAKKYAEGI